MILSEGNCRRGEMGMMCSRLRHGGERRGRGAEGGDWRCDTAYASGRGILYERDEEERQRRRREQGEQVIVYAEPRRNKTYHH
jgi:hypothetical protein